MLTFYATSNIWKGCVYMMSLLGAFFPFVERKHQVLNDAGITTPICTLLTQYESKHYCFYSNYILYDSWIALMALNNSHYAVPQNILILSKEAFHFSACFQGVSFIPN